MPNCEETPLSAKPALRDVGPDGRPRLLVYIPAFEAARHIEWVIDRIPRNLDDDFEVEVLIVDDASADGTAAYARRALERSDLPYPSSVLANPRNQGYGGNQKMGYQYAIAERFDVVVMVHGDGQYPPEAVADLAATALEHGAAFGSRFATRRSALRGGMPRYKYVGNRILTRFQNGLLETELTEFHSGFRAYRVDTLRRIPFELNSNDFHFDTEIFIQCTRASITIGEIAIPTHYGDEQCRVDGLSYARHVLSQTFRSKLHDKGLFYERKFDVAGRVGLYEPKTDFPSPSTAALARVVPHSTVLDLGCSDGHLAQILRDRGCRVIGVDLEEPDDTGHLDKFIQWNLDDGMPPIEDEVDVVLLMDIVEHLRSPEDFCSELARFCRDHEVRQVLASTGNVAFLVQRVMLALGQFNYGPRGILDMTHTRLFTKRTIERLFRQAGFQVDESFGLPVPFPLAFGSGALATVALALNRLAIRFSTRAFSYQLFLSLRPPVDLDELITHSTAYADVVTH